MSSGDTQLRRAVVVGSLGVLGAGCSRVGNYGLLEPVSTQGERVVDLYAIFFWAAAFIAALVYALIAFSVVRYRRRSNELPSQTQYHVALEVTYTVIPLLMVVGLFVATVTTQQQVERVADDPDVRVEVTGFQWDWRFAYPDDGVVISGSPGSTAELVIPARSTIQLTVTSKDVLHSFWVPELLFKRDLFPGSSSTFDVDTTQEGVFAGRCAEFCGLRHAEMDFRVRVVSPDAFRQWLDEQRSASS